MASSTTTTTTTTGGSNNAATGNMNHQMASTVATTPSSSLQSSPAKNLFTRYRTVGNDSTIGFMFCGGVSGTISRTCAAPFERLKILFQVQDLGYAKNGLGSDAVHGHRYNGIVSGMCVSVKQ